jgi:hypothetical protein
VDPEMRYPFESIVGGEVKCGQGAKTLFLISDRFRMLRRSGGDAVGRVDVKKGKMKKKER